MRETQRLRELRENDKKNLTVLREQKNRAVHEHNRRIFEIDETIVRLENSIEIWTKMINQLGDQDAS